MPKTLIADAYHLNGFGTCEIQSKRPATTVW